MITAALTGGALALLDRLVTRPPRLLELAVLVLASAAATVTRYVALRTWVFARPGAKAGHGTAYESLLGVGETQPGSS
jgi:hypothetical protein